VKELDDMTSARIIRVALIAALVMLAWPYRGDAKTTPRTTVEPSAQRLLQAAAAYLKQQQSYAFSADIVYDDVQPPDFKIQIHASAQYTIKRPNLLRVDYAGDRRQASFYIDGKNFVLYDRATNTYGELQAASDIESTLNAILDKYDFSVPLADFVANDPYQALASQVQGAVNLGPSTVRGFPTHHLVFTQSDIDWQIWIDDGATPLIRELEITYKSLPGQPEYMATFTDWKFAPADRSVFSFTPPPNAVLIDFIAIKKESSGTSKP
jgi:hypothetical protein